MEPVEGVDYIVDRYKLLGLERYASMEEVRAAIKNGKAANHPDNFPARVSDAARNAAATEWRYIEFAENELADPKKKEVYDAKLRWFEENAVRFITPSPDREIAGLFPSKIAVDVDALLSGQFPDQSHAHQFLRNLTMGTSDRTLLLMKKAYEADKGDPETKGAYMDALQTALGALMMEEDLAWQAAGVHGRGDHAPVVTDPTFYVEDVQGEILETAGSLIPASVDRRVTALLNHKGSPLLLTNESGETRQLARPEDFAPTDRDALIEQAKQRFLKRTHALKKLAERKQQLVLDLLELAEKHVVSENNATGKTLIHLMAGKEGEEPVVGVSMMFDDATKQGEFADGYQGKTLQQLKAEGCEHDAYTITAIPELLGSKSLAFTHFTGAYHCFKPQEQQREVS